MVPSKPVKQHKVTPREAAVLLAQRDPVVNELMKQSGIPSFSRTTGSHFAALVLAITNQQLAEAAVRAIHGRLVAALGGDVTPVRIMAMSTSKMRTVGLSGNKILSLRDLSTKVLDGRLDLNPRHLARMSDEEITASLTTVRGIGKWSADMFMMFRLGRLDIWPTDDLGVRRGYAKAWGIQMPSPKQLNVLGEPYRPYRTILAWYCWRANIPEQATLP